MKSTKYLWSYTDNSKTQFWSEGTEQCYFSYESKNEYMPDSLINNFKHAKISLPQKLSIDVFSKYFILASGIIDAKRDYFHSRPSYPYHIILIVLKGTLSCVVDNKRIECENGTIISIPSGKLLEERVKCARCRVLWIHLAPTLIWNSSLGKQISFRKATHLEDINMIVEILKKEIYAINPSILFLQNAVSIFAELLKREFSAEDFNESFVFVNRLADEIQNFPNKNWKSKDYARKLSVSQPYLDSMFFKKFSLTFSKFVLKIRMEKTLKLLTENILNYSEIAKEVGYMDQSSLSKAFKKYYGCSLKNHKKIANYNNKNFNFGL